jgi:hypothetical protein
MYLSGGKGRYPYNRGYHLLVAAELFVYGDESGIEPSHPYCVIAGFIASPQHWDTFNQQWRAILEEAGACEFHSAYFFNRRVESSDNPYREWSDAKADKFHSDLWEVINTHHRRVRPVGCVLDTEAFFSFSHSERQLLTGGEWSKERGAFKDKGSPRRTYPIPFFNMISQALDMAQPPDCKVHFVMDEQKIIQNRVRDQFAKARRDERLSIDLRRKMGDLTPGLSHEHEGIQAADLLAHIWYSVYLRGPGITGARVDAFKQLIKHHNKEPGVIRKRGLQKMLSWFDPEELRRIQALPPPKQGRRKRS